MRQLEVMSVSDDGTHILLGASEDAARATHQLRIDNRLVAAINGELDEDAEHRESELSPKEIQARLRAGDSVEQVAKAARIPVSRIMIYATPVISERARIIDQARAARVRRPRGPESTASLGSVVAKRLTEITGLRPETVEWSAKRREDGAWSIALSYSARGGSRTALWLWRPSGRELTALNALGTRLGAQEPPAPPRRKRPAAPPEPAPAAPKRSTTPRKAASAAKPAAKPAAPKRAVKAAKPRAVQTRVRRPRPEPRPAPALEPPEKKNGRVPVPTWDSVLLGVASPADRGRRRS
ncbi:MAG TPA: septation protein SepH [Mycobacteriales bacterium]|nr:septation protein SepH [Mycobacteriales bacterium]